jgi:vancomycin resistance protein YoaR
VGQALRGTNIDPVVRLDEAALRAAVTSALAPLATNPVDATVSMSASGPVATPAQDGRSVDPGPAIVAALDALRATGAPAELVIPVSVAPVPPVVSDEVALATVTSTRHILGHVVVTSGKLKWTVPSANVRAWISFTTQAGTIVPVADPALVAKSLAKVAKAVARKPISATFLRSKSGRIVGVAASGNGRSLNTDVTVNRILAELASRLVGGKAAPVKVATLPVAPQYTTAQAQKKAPLMSILGTWTTWFPIGDHNFWGANIWIPASIIDGTVLQPGQTFDWWNTVGDVSTARGFGPGGFIKGDHTEPTGALGGGMCSSSTTLFNAALRAGLQMGKRGNHTYYITRYPLGLDATVWKAGSAVQDMSFTNDTRGIILIRGIRTRAGLTGYVTYQLWGVPDGRTVSLSAPTVTNVIQATTKTVKVGTLPHGQVKQTEWPSNQMDTAVTRVVRNAAGQVIHLETWRSHYVLWNGLIQVGL